MRLGDKRIVTLTATLALFLIFLWSMPVSSLSAENRTALSPGHYSPGKTLNPQQPVFLDKNHKTAGNTALQEPSPKVSVVSNGIYDLIISDSNDVDPGVFTIRTGPEYSPSGKNIFYGADSLDPWTSYLTVRSYTSQTNYISTAFVASPGVEDTVYNLAVLGPVGIVTHVANGFVTTWSFENPTAEESFAIFQETILEGSTQQDARLRVTTTVENTGPAAVDIGIRHMWDLMVADNDAAVFAERIPNKLFTDTFQEWVPPAFEAYEFTDNASFPTFRIFGSANGPTFPIAVTGPDVLQYASWADLDRNPFDYTPIQDAEADAAVAYIWGDRSSRAITLNPGQSKTVTAYVYTRAPQFVDLEASIIADTITVGDLLDFDLNAIGSIPGGEICIEAVSILPEFVTFNDTCGLGSVSARVTAAPVTVDVGSYNLIFRAVLESELEDVDTVRLVVEAPLLGEPPQFISPSPCGSTVNGIVGSDLSIQARAIDNGTNNDEVTIIVSGGLPPGVMIPPPAVGNPATMNISISPTLEQVGTHTITLLATDALDELADTCVFDLVISAPVGDFQIDLPSTVPSPYPDYLYDRPINVWFNQPLSLLSLTNSVILTSAKGNNITDSLLTVYNFGDLFFSIEFLGPGLFGEHEFIPLDTIRAIIDANLESTDGQQLDTTITLTFLIGPAVYPGDTDNNGVVDERDVLPLGMFWGETGFERPDSLGLLWAKQAAHRFDELRATYADADGNGVVADLDICGITDNWGRDTADIELVDNPGYLINNPAFKGLGSAVLQEMYAALIDCPVETSGKAALLQMFATMLENSTEYEILPDEYTLEQNYPNPFNPSTTIRFSLLEDGLVRLTVYNVMGQAVKTLADRHITAGSHEVTWDGNDQSGRTVSSGIYFYRLEAGDVEMTKRMLLLK